MAQHSLVQPVVALLVWSMVMFVWMYATRIPAMVRAGVDLKHRVGGQGADLDKILPPEIQWKAHNYNHLMEQPTLFYAAAFALIATASDSRWVVLAAWGYVAIRIAHSLVQAITNRVAVRFLLFVFASLCLMVMIGFAVSSAF